MALAVKFVQTTLTAFKNITTPDPSTLYFLSDSKDIYKGAQKYTGAIEFYAGTRPTTGIEGRLYVDTTGATGASIYSGGVWTIVAGDVSQTVLDAGTPVTKAVSGKAVKDFIDGLSLAKESDVITAITFDPATTSLKYTKNGTDTTLNLTKLATTFAYDGATGKLSLKDSAGTELSSTTIPLDNFLKDGKYDSTAHALVLDMQNGTQVTIPAGDLVALYDATDTSTVDVTIQANANGNNTISAKVKISTNASNALAVDAEGLFVDKEAIRTIGATTDAGKVVTLDANGKLAISTKNVADLATTADVAASTPTWTTI